MDDGTNKDFNSTSGEFRLLDYRVAQSEHNIKRHDSRIRKLERVYWKTIGFVMAFAMIGAYVGSWIFEKLKVKG